MKYNSTIKKSGKNQIINYQGRNLTITWSTTYRGWNLSKWWNIQRQRFRAAFSITFLSMWNLAILSSRRRDFRFILQSQVKHTWSTFHLISFSLSQEIFLCMTSNLGWGLVITNFYEISIQSCFPSWFRPIRNNLCSSSVHRFPETNSKLTTLKTAN